MLILNIGIPSVIFVILGCFLIKLFDSTFLEVFLGGFLIVFSLLFSLKVTLQSN
jgi:hypothetical protein